MIEVIGKNGTAKIMTDMRDEQAITHLYHIMSAGITENSTVRIMADYHEGKGSVIGFTQRLNKSNPRICPSVTGVDLGCRISSMRFDKINNLDFDKIDKWIRGNVPLGAGGYLNGGISSHLKTLIFKNELKSFEDAEKLIKEDGKTGYNMKVNVINQLFSIESGNHFIAINQDKDGKYWLSLHCGSRNFGLVVANIYQTKAIEYCEDNCEKDLKYLDNNTPFLERYLTCVNACQIFSEVNHRLLFDKIGRFLCENFSEDKKFEYNEYITTLHNYIDLENMIVRKGAISARNGEKVLIPFNMRDGISVCIGKGNEEYNFSAPHGAGRIMSRSQAKKVLDLESVKKDMQDHGVFTTSIDYALDEAPDAYKDKDEIIKYIEPTVLVTDVMKEVYNIKGK